MSGASAAPARVLSLRQAVLLIVGIVVGAGIFKAPSVVAASAGSERWMFAAWVLGGLISLVGALCYAELATTYPHAGGDYHYLRRAYGRHVAFLFGWARFAVITTGSIALLGFVFGDYMQQLLPLAMPPGRGAAAYAFAAVAVLWWVNARGIRAGASTQSLLTAVEVSGLLLVVMAALWLGAGIGIAAAAESSVAVSAPEPRPSAAAFGMAMVFVLLTYGGWNEAAYVSAELKEPRRNMVRALVLSIAIITVLYLLVNWAYWRGLGFEGMARSEALAADLMRNAFGVGGEKLISLLVAIAALTSMNATMIVGARSNYAVGADWAALQKMAHWDGERGTPAIAMHVQNGAAMLLVLVGASVGSGFRAMVEFTAPVFWLFFLLTGLALLVLRVREPHVERPFRVPLFPVLPAMFCASSAYMLWSSLSYVYSQELGGINAAWIGVAVLAMGLLALVMVSRFAVRPATSKANIQ